MAKVLFYSPAMSSGSGISAGTKHVAETSVQATKSGFLHTVAEKISVVVIGLCITGGQYLQDNDTERAAYNSRRTGISIYNG